MPVGARPVDRARRQRRGVQTRLLGAAHHHREDDAIADAGELAVADDARAVCQRYSRNSIASAAAATPGMASQQERDKDESRNHEMSCAVPHCTLRVVRIDPPSSPARCGKVVDDACKTCGEPAHANFFFAGRFGNRRPRRCGRRLRVALRLIASERVRKITAVPPPRRTSHSDRSSFRRNHRRARVPHRGHARQQPLAGPAAARAGRPDRHDAVLRTHA